MLPLRADRRTFSCRWISCAMTAISPTGYAGTSLVSAAQAVSPTTPGASCPLSVHPWGAWILQTATLWTGHSTACKELQRPLYLPSPDSLTSPQTLRLPRANPPSTPLLGDDFKTGPAPVMHSSRFKTTHSLNNPPSPFGAPPQS